MVASLAHVLELAPRLIKRGETATSEPRDEALAPLRWEPELVRGRLVELTSVPGDAPLTAAFSLVRRFQRLGEPVAWISARSDLFFAPDVAAIGVNLEHLPVIRVRQAQHALRAACHLLRSGGFGCAVLDLGLIPRAPQALLSRLTRIAQHHDATVLVLTDKPPEAPSMGSLVSLRLSAQVGTREVPTARASMPVPIALSKPNSSSKPAQLLASPSLSSRGEHYQRPAGLSAKLELKLKALKDKSRAPGWTIAEVIRGSASMP